MVVSAVVAVYFGVLYLLALLVVDYCVWYSVLLVGIGELGVGIRRNFIGFGCVWV